jgi:hypothetical protein
MKRHCKPTAGSFRMTKPDRRQVRQPENEFLTNIHAGIGLEKLYPIYPL